MAMLLVVASAQVADNEGSLGRTLAGLVILLFVAILASRKKH